MWYLKSRGCGKRRVPGLCRVVPLRCHFGASTLPLWHRGSTWVPLRVAWCQCGATWELELIQSHMAQKPVLRGEVGCACVARDATWVPVLYACIGGLEFRAVPAATVRSTQHRGQSTQGLVSRSIRSISSFVYRHPAYFGVQTGESAGKPHEKSVWVCCCFGGQNQI